MGYKGLLVCRGKVKYNRKNVQKNHIVNEYICESCRCEKVSSFKFLVLSKQSCQLNAFNMASSLQDWRSFNLMMYLLMVDAALTTLQRVGGGSGGTLLSTSSHPVISMFLCASNASITT